MLTILHTQRNQKNMINQNLTPRKCDPIVSFSDRFVTIEHLFRIFNNNIAPKNIYFVRNPYFFIFSKIRQDFISSLFMDYYSQAKFEMNKKYFPKFKSFSIF